jgi:hypothetical protein
MEGRKTELLQRIESDQDVLLDFFRRFIRCPSPNPPGDTARLQATSVSCWRGTALIAR